MNDPNKVINVNLSSLLSLKAEVLRKQAEVSKAKVAQNSFSMKEREYISNKSLNKETNDYGYPISVKKRDNRKKLKGIRKINEATVYEQEDPVMLEKSQRVLEAKSKFYERMQKTGGKLNSDDNCLVMFNKKKQDEKQENRNHLESIYSSSESSVNNDSDHPDDPEDEWVEYTDCLGRTRTCLKRDLTEAKRKDEQLAASMPERLDQTKANWMIDTACSHKEDLDEDRNNLIGSMPPTSVFGDCYSTISKLEEQKVNWERKEQENLEKTDVHYQDVFFDEARQHGVGYYAFSTDEQERRKQQRELEKARQQTLEEQKRREILKQQREKILAERVLAAKNRQRARLGLPSLEKEIEKDKQDSVGEKPQESKEQRKARRKAEKLEKEKLKEKEKREKERLNHIRPWDKDKNGIAQKTIDNENDEEWQYKPEREPMTQEQWNEHKRNERLNEFAPPPPPTPKENLFKRTNFKSAANIVSAENYKNVPPPENLGFSKYQSTKSSKDFKRRYIEETHSLEEDCAKSGVCIPPAPNLEDAYLHSYNKTRSSSKLEKSIEAGLRFLRNNSDKEMASTKSTWTAKADY